MSDEHEPTDPDAWAGARVDRWVAMADRLDAQLAPVTDLLLAAARLRTGDRVLDVGCGTGPITRQAATIVGPHGSATGVDVAADMVSAARAATPETADAAPVRFIEADAASWSGNDLFDVVVSRFGTMFFDDPAAAFANLASLTRPSGRLTMAVWDRRDRSDLFEVPLAAAVEVLTAAGHDPDLMPVAGGPFSLSEPDAVATLLDDAGWRGVEIDHHEVQMLVGGGVDPAGAADDAFGVGPTRKATEGIDDALRADVRATIESRYREHVDGDGNVVMGGRVFVVSATR